MRTFKYTPQITTTENTIPSENEITSTQNNRQVTLPYSDNSYQKIDRGSSWLPLRNFLAVSRKSSRRVITTAIHALEEMENASWQ